MRLTFYIENEKADTTNPNIRGCKDTLDTLKEEIMCAIESIKSQDYDLDAHIYFNESQKSGIKIITDNLEIRKLVENELNKYSINVINSQPK